jgi:Asp-tRNA(Asn)/Glu-tRNA(Gln) amidotransferase A subunit family amidase
MHGSKARRTAGLDPAISIGDARRFRARSPGEPGDDRWSVISLLDTLRRIDAGELTPEQAIQASRKAIAAGDGELKAFVHLAENPTEGHGPLAGIAVGIKDIIDTADMPTEMGSRIYAGWRPKADAPVVAALRRAGATPIGKTTTTAFANRDPTPTVNPVNPAHTPGGSSAGSPAAVRAGMIPLALGTQTGGSVIRPASYCGVAAIKPSFRLIPTVGVKTYSWLLDTVGIFAATVDDVAFALATITGRADLRIDDKAVAPPRIAVVTQDFAGAPEQDSAAALEEAVRRVESAGAIVSQLDAPRNFADAWTAHTTLQDFEAAQALAWEYANHRDAIAPLVREALDRAHDVSVETYDDARRIAHRARLKLKDVFAEIDVLLTFAAPGAAPRGLGSTGDARFNRLWTLLGVPCVNVAGLTNAAGMPVGIQVIADFGHDAKALAAARFVEATICPRA